MEKMGQKAIISVGVEGGGLSLVESVIDGGRRFRIVVQSDAWLLDEDERPPPRPERPWVDTWTDALAELDAYPWTEFYPLHVDPDYREAVWAAVRVRRPAERDWKNSVWAEVLREAGQAD